MEMVGMDTGGSRETTWRLLESSRGDTRVA